MPLTDIQIVFQWWSVLFFIGVAAFPLTKKLFSGWLASRSPASRDEGWYDQGYLFSKAVGMAGVSYIVYLFGTLHIMPFDIYSVLTAMGILFLFGVVLFLRSDGRVQKQYSYRVVVYGIEEIVFFGALLLWAYVKAHEPSIRGLEKFMDYGFMQSVLNSPYFPAPDMWYAGSTINYYYFGHVVTAVLTRLSGLDLGVTFNLMLATIFALTLTMSFNIGCQLQLRMTNDELRIKNIICACVGGVFTAFLVTLAGNMQTLYAFTKGYTGDDVVPFWTVLYAPSEFLAQVGEGMTRYWYANATRFIPFTIHEFPSYSFVVSDIHGHVLSLPFVLLAIALIIQLFNNGLGITHYLSDRNQSAIRNSQFINYIFYGFLLAVLLMTNAFDGPIYFGLFVVIFGITNYQLRITPLRQGKVLIPLGITGIIMIVTALPFLTHFSSFATGIGVNCPPAFLANTQIGPFIFEGVEKCQKSPLWMLWLLWGFFWYTGIWLFIKRVWGDANTQSVHRILKVFFLYALVLIIVPEFLYAKDIYPAHYRSNTMFKLGYEAFILWSIVAGYVIVHFIFQRQSPRSTNDEVRMTNKNAKFKILNYKTLRTLFFVLLIPQLFLVSIYPIFSVRSYFGELRTYKSIDGLSWLREEYPNDWEGIIWLKNQLRIANGELPILVEADGDSYTDYNHMSAFSGTPSVIGWAVHEWLWRGSYDVVAPRRSDVETIYTSNDEILIKRLLTQYHVRYIVVGKLEREKYPALNEEMLRSIAIPVFTSGDMVIYEVIHN